MFRLNVDFERRKFNCALVWFDLKQMLCNILRSQQFRLVQQSMLSKDKIKWRSNSDQTGVQVDADYLQLIIDIERRYQEEGYW